MTRDRTSERSQLTIQRVETTVDERATGGAGGLKQVGTFNRLFVALYTISYNAGESAEEAFRRTRDVAPGARRRALVCAGVKAILRNASRARTAEAYLSIRGRGPAIRRIRDVPRRPSE
jgi:hypothetical protein